MLLRAVSILPDIAPGSFGRLWAPSGSVAQFGSLHPRLPESARKRPPPTAPSSFGRYRNRSKKQH
eukprot:10737596-Alexandrium_andersonii.AAC.1